MRTQTLTADQWLRRDEAARHARVSLRTLVSWFALGLQAYRVGGVVLISRDELDTFILSHSCESASRK